VRDEAALDRLHDEACAALAAAIHAGTATPPPTRGRTAARNWSITVARLRDRQLLRVLGAAHGGLSKERTRQVVTLTTLRWAWAQLPGFEARWRAAAYGPPPYVRRPAADA
jgi:hypothetical protein